MPCAGSVSGAPFSTRDTGVSHKVPVGGGVVSGGTLQEIARLRPLHRGDRGLMSTHRSFAAGLTPCGDRGRRLRHVSTVRSLVTRVACLPPRPRPCTS